MGLMNFIKKIILTLFIFLCPIGAFGYDVQNNDLFHQITITAPKHFEKDFIKSDTQLSDIAIIQNNFSSFRKAQRSCFNGLGNRYCASLAKSNFDFKNIVLEEFLDKKSKTVISFLLFQIQPNAP